MKRTVAAGISSFSEIIKDNHFYIDKTDFIKEWWENKDKATLITRPRRFGKTLTVSMLEAFFSITYAGREDLFRGLSIWKEEEYRRLQGTYPVISLSFAGIKGQTRQEAYADICRTVARKYRDYVSLIDSTCFIPADRSLFLRIMEGNADISDMKLSIRLLSEFLYRYYEKKVILLLDEYDTPMHEAYMKGYWDELVDFMRGLLENAFKDNPYLERGMLTGITRISRESLFSGLNNLIVITTTSNLYETAFGFTEQEVFSALEEFGLQDEQEGVKQWYDGFRFGDCDNIYNPWSIVNYLKFKKFDTYWINTSSNQLAGELIRRGDIRIKHTVEDLLNGKTFSTPIDEQVVFSQLNSSRAALWSLLLAGGYLKITGTCRNKRNREEYVLALVNREVREAFAQMCVGWFSDSQHAYSDFSDALISGNKEFLNEYMGDIVNNTLSYYDTGKSCSKSKVHENFYHGLVLGLIADLKDLYVITSNRESGSGRYDVMLAPRHKEDNGIIIEFKVMEPAKEGSLKDTVKAAVSQIMHKKYASVLEAEGICRERILVYGFAFSGKHVLIDGGRLSRVQSAEPQAGFSSTAGSRGRVNRKENEYV